MDFDPLEVLQGVNTKHAFYSWWGNLTGESLVVQALLVLPTPAHSSSHNSSNQRWIELVCHPHLLSLQRSLVCDLIGILTFLSVGRVGTSQLPQEE